MKRIVKHGLLLALLPALLCVAAAAGEYPSESGMYQVSAALNSVTARPDGSRRTGVTIGEKTDQEYYANAAKLTVKYESPSTVSAGNQYLVLLIRDVEGEDQGNPAITEDTILYIDQHAGGSGSVSFEVYPSQLTAGSYSVYMISDKDATLGTLTRVAAFDYYAAYLRGDATGDGKVSPSDATQILRYYVELSSAIDDNPVHAAAADANLDKKISPVDATWVLQRYVGLRDENYDLVSP